MHARRRQRHLRAGRLVRSTLVRVKQPQGWRRCLGKACCSCNWARAAAAAAAPPARRRTLQLSILRSIRVTSTPPLASVSAAQAPLGPPPITATRSFLPSGSAWPSLIARTVTERVRCTRAAPEARAMRWETCILLLLRLVVVFLVLWC